MVAGIRDSSAFKSFDGTAIRARSGPITVVRSTSYDTEEVIVAFAIPRRVGGAVVRNRLRRQIRAVIGELESTSQVPDAAYLIVVRPEAAGAQFDQLRSWLSRALTKLA